MSSLKYSQIINLQKQYNLTEMQNNINSGLCWKLEGSFGRAAMECLRSGACMLPKVMRYDAFNNNNNVPSRNILKAGTQGTFQNSQNFWQKVLDGEIDL